jgi:hypothetical protein
MIIIQIDLETIVMFRYNNVRYRTVAKFINDLKTYQTSTRKFQTNR